MTYDKPMEDQTTSVDALSAVAEKLVNDGLVTENWAEDMRNWGDAIALYRDYMAGRHRIETTREMDKLLRIEGKPAGERFAVNYCPLVVTRKTDKLIVKRIEAIADGDSAVAQQWVDEVLDNTRFDALQIDGHSAMIGDGAAFIGISTDGLENGGLATMTLEPAYNGSWGTIPVYDRTRTKLIAAVKIWEEQNETRVNIYYPDKIEKYTTVDSGLSPFEVDGEEWPAPWLDRNGNALGIPIIPFKNDGQPGQSAGESAIAKMIPCQDILNRTMMSATITIELTGFPLFALIGGSLENQNFSPGAVIEIAPDGAEKENHMPSLTKLPPSEIRQFVDQAQFVIDQIGTITNTPLPSLMGGDSQSGEALKQREAGLLAWARRAQVKTGNAWEDAMAMVWKTQKAMGKTDVPEIKRFNTVWQDPQVRNEKEMIEKTVKISDKISGREFLRRIDYDDATITKIEEEKAKEAELALASLRLAAPNFSSLAMPSMGATA